jgi:hypothetical protein
MTPCHQKECGCRGFVQVHWDNEEEPDEEAEDYIDDVKVIEESK